MKSNLDKILSAVDRPSYLRLRNAARSCAMIISDDMAALSFERSGTLSHDNKRRIRQTAKRGGLDIKYEN